MKKRRLIGIAFVVIVVIVLSSVLLFEIRKKETSRNNSDMMKNLSDDEEGRCFGNNCEGHQRDCEGGKIKFDYPPINLEKTSVVVPFGLMTGNHVTPIDHQYFQDFNNDEANIEVYSPGDGRVREIQFMIGEFPDKGKLARWEDYRLEVQHTCTISSTYIHVDRLSEKIAAKAPKKEGYARVNIPVKAGEIIGWYSKNVDYNLVDLDVVLQGFVVPEHYAGEPWKIHVPDTLDYFNETIRKKMIEKNLRTAEPISGKFDYDIDGKLIGNWFREGKGGYGGGGARREYWKTHLSISPDYLDPNHIIVSIGDYRDGEAQFGVLGNSPNPAEVGVSSGMIKYELVPYDYYTLDGRVWNRGEFAKIKEARNYDFVDGVILLELVEDRKLKVESFPGKKGSEVEGFSENALIYER